MAQKFIKRGKASCGSTTVNLDEQARKDISYIIHHSSAASTASAVIRGMAHKYRRLLQKQVDTESTAKELLLLEMENCNGIIKEVSREVLDLKL